MIRSFCFFFGFLFPAAALLAKPALPACFSDHMVLQRGKPIPVWGKADPGETVSLSFLGATTTTKADAKDGTWRVELPAAQAGGPYELTVKDGPAFKDVLVGDVWLGSGQSNMAGHAGGYAKNDDGLKAILAAAPYPRVRLLRQAGPWMEANEKTCSGFSAILLSFGLELHKDLDVPIGLRVGAVGGTPSGRWLTPEMFNQNEAAVAMLKEYGEKTSWEEIEKKHAISLEKWEKVVAKLKEEGKTKFPRKPKLPQKPGTLPTDVGGLYKGHIESFEGYGIKGILWDQGESGTKITGVDQYTTMGALISGWREAFGQDVPFLYVQKPSGGGSAWDQNRPENIRADKFTALAGGKAVPKFDSYRILHTEIRKYPDTAIVQAVDLGSGVHPANKSGYGKRAALVAKGIAYEEQVVWSGPQYTSHEAKDGKLHLKFDHVGSGLAFKGGDRPSGFAIAGEDGVFHWAEAEITDKDTVILSAEKVPSPAMASYGFEKKRTYANVFNKEGLPMMGFRTDWTPPAAK